MEGITYQQLEAANRTIKPTDIKGKDYAEVNQRVRAFRMVYPTGFIRPEMLSDEGGICKFRAEVGYHADDGRDVLLGVGHAFERENGSYINKTSYIENCETSAVGRALGMAGFGIDTSVASAEEVQTAILNQEQKCEECGQEIMDTVIKGGNIWPAAKIIGYSQRRFNRILCPDCQKKQMKEEKA